MRENSSTQLKRCMEGEGLDVDNIPAVASHDSRELAAYCGKLSAQQSAPPDLQAVEKNFRILAARLEQHE